MTFTIQRSVRHIEGAGLHNEYYERDVPCDVSADIDVDAERVKADVAALIYDSFFTEKFRVIRTGVIFDPFADKRVRESMIARIKRLLEVLDVWDAAIDEFRTELCDKYEGEYNR